jgi:hypothetical protein
MNARAQCHLDIRRPGGLRSAAQRDDTRLPPAVMTVGLPARVE